MKNEIIDVNACYKNINENNVSAILEVKHYGKEDFEKILKYDFSLNNLEMNSIKIYKDIPLKELYDLYVFVKNKNMYKGIFDIYFKIYKNDINNLRSYAVEKMKELDNPEEYQETIFEKIKGSTKKLFQEIWDEGSTNELNGIITKVAAYKKECPAEKTGEYANRYVIDIIRYGTDSWENIYSYEYGKYKTGGILKDVDCVSVYKVLTDKEIFKMVSLFNNKEEYEVMTKYLKTSPKEPHGELMKKEEEKQQIENIKFI